MNDLDAEIAAFISQHTLPIDLSGPISALVSRVQNASRLSTELYAVEPIDLDRELLPPTESGARLTDRYEDVGLIGVGGMGEVRRVRDRDLNRIVAMKVIKPELVATAAVLARFVEEAQVGAQLQHPGVAPVHEFGRLADGRWYFTMKEVKGRALTDHVRAMHSGSASAYATELHRLVDAFKKACDAVAYAHARGVVHRDLKPDNILLGGFGEVQVVDWGLAKVLHRRAIAWDDESIVTRRTEDEALRTRMGTVAGTPAYMAPEQARGEIDALDARTDVYALGAVLYEILCDHPPYTGSFALDQVLSGPPRPVGEVATIPPPDDLARACARAMARDPADRHASAVELGEEIRAWLDGARRREQALEVVAAADALVAEAGRMRDAARALQAEGEGILAGVPTWAPDAQKTAGWAKQDEAARLAQQAGLLELQREAGLRSALSHDPALAEAHAALIQIELDRHAAAEAVRDAIGAARADARAREHVEALPDAHPVRIRATRYLRGDGALSLVADPPDVRVDIHRFEEVNRRLVPTFVRSHHGPIRELPLERGSYLCEIHAADRPMVRVPVHIARGAHWDDPLPIRIPSQAELGSDVFVPHGPFWCGDPDALNGLVRRRLWCADFAIQRFAVTHRDYIVFLDDLVAQGRDADAEALAPRERGPNGEDGAIIYGRDPQGRFFLRPDADGDMWEADWPVMMVHWGCASAYAAWLAAREGRPWRLPGELEWEKAAGGVDGRRFPWGDRFDESWCNVRGSQERAWPATVHAFPLDETVYGVRGMGGNMREWCADAWSPTGPPVDGDRVVQPMIGPSEPQNRAIRGGSWFYPPDHARVAYRDRFAESDRVDDLGFRLARPL